jgi:exopolysaccharide biosynthesis operon protein EpsL
VNNIRSYAIAALLMMVCAITSARAQDAATGGQAESGATNATATPAPPGTQPAPLPGATPSSTYQAPSVESRAELQLPVLAFIVGAYETWDSNFFRLPDSANPQSERYTTAYVGVRFDKVYGQQEFQLDATQSAVRYHKFSFNDFNPLAYRGAWLWRIGPRVSGTLSAAQSQYLYSFADTRNLTQRNVTTSNSNAFTVDGWVSGGWHLVGAALYDKTHNSVPVLATPNFQESGGQGGVKYITSSGNTVAANYRTLHGSYDRPLDSILVLDDGYRRNESELLATWAPTGKSALRGRLAWVQYKADTFSQRDYSGAAGYLGYAWTPSAAWRLDFLALRDLQTFWDNLSSYRVIDLFSFTPVWNLTSQIALSGELAYETDHYRQPVIPLSGAIRTDDVRRARISLGWSPIPSLRLDASIAREERNSNVDVNDYVDTLSILSATFTF